MRTGRVIKIKTPILRRVRNSLRSLLLTIVKERIHRSIDFGKIQFSVNNMFGVQKVNQEINELYRLVFDSICICKFCRDTERDAVYIHHNVIDQFTYPPLEKHEKHSSSFWVCPDCYRKLMEKVEFYKKEGYYFFRNYGIFDTLKSLGIESPDELDEF